jgi:co-chaperonin GroES (HSP10)
MDVTVQCYLNKVLVKDLTHEEKVSKGGIILDATPDKAELLAKGEVVSVGKDAFTRGVRVGQKVLFNGLSNMRLTINGSNHYLLQDVDIFGFVVPEKELETK